MTKEELISSGLLELYVSGSLDPKEVMEVEAVIDQYPEVIREIEIIEQSYIQLSESLAPKPNEDTWKKIINRISSVRTLKHDRKSSISWVTYSGWAAALLCLGGIFWMLKENNQLQNTLRTTSTENVLLKEQIKLTEGELAENSQILDAIRSEEYAEVVLAGNVAVAPEALVKIYYNDKEQIAYIDAKGLPTPPRGKVYQVWSLLMDPLTPTNAGLLAAFEVSDNKIFKVEGLPVTEGFGITLEPEGGSESPTLSQLYVLGTVAP